MPLIGKALKSEVIKEDPSAFAWNSKGFERGRLNDAYKEVDAGLKVSTGPEAPVLSTQRLAEARRAGLDLNTLAFDELDAFASGGLAGLTRYRAGIWDEEAEKRPAQPNVLA